jgi:hypothetical protein
MSWIVPEVEANAERESFIAELRPEFWARRMPFYISIIITFDVNTTSHFSVISKKRTYVQRNS